MGGDWSRPAKASGGEDPSGGGACTSVPLAQNHLDLFSLAVCSDHIHLNGVTCIKLGDLSGQIIKFFDPLILKRDDDVPWPESSAVGRAIGSHAIDHARLSWLWRDSQEGTIAMVDFAGDKLLELVRFVALNTRAEEH